MQNPDAYKGVMTARYAASRLRSKALIFRYRTRARTAFNAARNHLNTTTPLKVLDLGAAEGLTLLHLRSLLEGQGEYCGIELSHELLACAPELPPGVSLLHGDVMRLPESVQPDHFDLCMLLAVLEHLHDPLAALKEACRALKPGGIIALSCPNPFWDHVAGALSLVEDEHHAQELNASSLKALLQQAGFTRITYHPFMWAPLGILPYMGIPLSPQLCLRLDRMIEKCRIFNFAFVNQSLIAQKPL